MFSILFIFTNVIMTFKISVFLLLGLFIQMLITIFFPQMFASCGNLVFSMISKHIELYFEHIRFMIQGLNYTFCLIRIYLIGLILGKCSYFDAIQLHFFSNIVLMTNSSKILLCAVLSRSVMSNSYDPIDCSLPGTSVHGILPARILEWVTISFSK